MMELYQWWRDARQGRMGEISVDDPKPGFYRVSKFKGGPLVPLAIFPNEHREIIGYLDGKDVDHMRVCELWPFAARNHVDEAVWRDVAELGKPWPDIDPAVAAQQNGRHGIGGNRGPTDDAEVIREQIESASASLGEYAEIASDEQRDRAQTLRSRLLELSGQADKLREKLKRPHIEAGRDVDAKWQPLVKAAKTAADIIRAALSTWETRKYQEQIQRATAYTVTTEHHPDLVQYGNQVVPTKFKGGAGRSASTSVVKTVKSVTDWPVLLAHFAETREVRDLVLELAKKSVKAGFMVPGVDIQDEVDVR